MKKLVIFDLDGTLVNTIADLAESVNYALIQCGFPTHTLSDYRNFVGNGVLKLVERALPENARDPKTLKRVREHFYTYYDIHNTDASKPYAGIPELLDKLQSEKLKIAVASNKYHRATEKIIRHIFPQIEFSSILGQRDGIAIKPDPAIIYETMNITKVTSKDDVLYVGDSGVDMQTALNADIECCGVTWGFRPESELRLFSPQHIISSANQIASLLKLR